jgi:hypothetical protein
VKEERVPLRRDGGRVGPLLIVPQHEGEVIPLDFGDVEQLPGQEGEGVLVVLVLSFHLGVVGRAGHFAGDDQPAFGLFHPLHDDRLEDADSGFRQEQPLAVLVDADLEILVTHGKLLGNG